MTIRNLSPTTQHRRSVQPMFWHVTGSGSVRRTFAPSRSTRLLNGSLARARYAPWNESADFRARPYTDCGLATSFDCDVVLGGSTSSGPRGPFVLFGLGRSWRV